MADRNHTVLSLGEGDTLLSRYRLERLLGRGGMGAVWLARDELVNRSVAIKLLPDALSRDERALERLKAEANRNFDLTHPNIVRLHNFERDPARGCVAFLVMQYIDGRTLDQLLTMYPKGLDVGVCYGLFEQVAKAVDYAHERGVLHRDIKPANIMVESGPKEGDFNAYLMDFGIASEIRDNLTRVTGAQDSSGTLPYMSPQQLRGDSQRSNDVYSFAATYYEALCGRPPFHTGDIAYQINHSEPEAIPNCPPILNAQLLWGLMKDASQRPSTCHALLHSSPQTHTLSGVHATFAVSAESTGRSYAESGNDTVVGSPQDNSDQDEFGEPEPAHGKDLETEYALSPEDLESGTFEVAFTRLDVCPICAITGSNGRTRMVQCDRCKGSGTLIPDPGKAGDSIGCPSCNFGVIFLQNCKDCAGTGRKPLKRVLEVKVPPNVAEGARLRVVGEGEPPSPEVSPSGLGVRGDLYVLLHLPPVKNSQAHSADIAVESQQDTLEQDGQLSPAPALAQSSETERIPAVEPTFGNWVSGSYMPDRRAVEVSTQAWLEAPLFVQVTSLLTSIGRVLNNTPWYAPNPGLPAFATSRTRPARLLDWMAGMFGATIVWAICVCALSLIGPHLPPLSKMAQWPKNGRDWGLATLQATLLAISLSTLLLNVGYLFTSHSQRRSIEVRRTPIFLAIGGAMALVVLIASTSLRY